MKCPKCGYHSFEHLDSCRKCNSDLSEHKIKFNLRGFFSTEQAAQSGPDATAVEGFEETEEGREDAADFGFDFLEEEEDPASETANATSLGIGKEDVRIDQPFGVDSESLPADDPSFEEDGDDDHKPKKGPEFSF